MTGVAHTALACKRVFVSSQTYTANLGGLAGADASCQTLADHFSANLGGTWKAFLSDSSTTASSRLTHSPAPYKLVNGTTVAVDAAQFFSTSHLTGISLDEHGSDVGNSEVWTGSGGSGVGNGGCSNWMSTGGSSPSVGLTILADAGWANIYLQFCDSSNVRLYCVEQ